MIRYLVDSALNNRFVVLGLAILIFGVGYIAFHTLPVEAYPDVANTWVQVITQWPGRAAEEVEQQITVPIEIQMNGIPHLQHVRSASLAGLSVVDQTDDALRQAFSVVGLNCSGHQNGVAPPSGKHLLLPGGSRKIESS